ncbi:hypothetical protein EMPS_06854 [Entomortierella parvispora]|uniref:Rieske domain-containing protein n=1 Tax=Entomortierella parvispora TaxID=205924 RepID=A0A9P3HCZ8_9FUNG|nr:hypothetical protein EMPS_06854 [Entomortierella parvispora]
MSESTSSTPLKPVVALAEDSLVSSLSTLAVKDDAVPSTSSTPATPTVPSAQSETSAIALEQPASAPSTTPAASTPSTTSASATNDSTVTATDATTTTTTKAEAIPTVIVQTPQEPEEEELSEEEAKLRAKGLKSTHRPGFFIHIDSPKRLRIQTKSKTFDLDRYCPHAHADMLKWGVLRGDMTLRCGVHYWGFDLVKNGQCIAHPDETLNACPVADSELEW